MSTNKKLPPELLATRPVLGEDPWAEHPSMGPIVGAPPKDYTPAVHQFIINKIQSGSRPKIAAAEAGITAVVFARWMKQGKEGHPHLAKFAADVEQAMAIAENRALQGVIGDMNDPEWNASAEDMKWYLERTRPDGYDKNVATRVQAEVHGFLERLEANLPTKLFELVIKAAAGEMVSSPPEFLLTDGSTQDDE